MINYTSVEKLLIVGVITRLVLVISFNVSGGFQRPLKDLRPSGSDFRPSSFLPNRIRIIMPAIKQKLPVPEA